MQISTITNSCSSANRQTVRLAGGSERQAGCVAILTGFVSFEGRATMVRIADLAPTNSAC
jgi:hypothetical protein